MKQLTVGTRTGDIAVQVRPVEGTLPLILLHGVYFDHHLWDRQVEQIRDRTVITLDMPLHGNSRSKIARQWNLEDCAVMLLDILKELKIERVIAIGHSWGSMTILRAAVREPERFAALGLCNMPFQAAGDATRWRFRLQHLMLPFRNFYIRKVAGALFDKESLERDPGLSEHLRASMGRLTPRQIRQTDRQVILRATDTKQLLEQVAPFARALKGKADYVPEPRPVRTRIVEGGHVSPLEVPDQVTAFIREILEELA